jgi:hypothetical protein
MTEKGAEDEDGLDGNECVTSHQGLVCFTRRPAIFKNIMKENIISLTYIPPFETRIHVTSLDRTSF